MPATNGNRTSRNKATTAMTAANIAIQNRIGLVKLMIRSLDPRIPTNNSRLMLNRFRNASISVEDQGSGIPNGLLDRIFEPLLTTKPVGQGTGLGLSMVYGFVKQSKGYINITSALGPERYSTIDFSFFPPADCRSIKGHGLRLAFCPASQCPIAEEVPALLRSPGTKI